MRHQLEFDLMAMSNEKRSRKNALRRRVAPPTSTPHTLETPGMASPGYPDGTGAGALTTATELRRLASGQAADEWDVVVVDGDPAKKTSPRNARNRRRQGKNSRADGGGGGGEYTGGFSASVSGGGAALSRSEGMEGGAVLRDHEWVMERVKMKKREESRLKRTKFGGKGSAIWSPAMGEVRVFSACLVRLVCLCAGVGLCVCACLSICLCAWRFLLPGWRFFHVCLCLCGSGCLFLCSVGLRRSVGAYPWKGKSGRWDKKKTNGRTEACLRGVGHTGAGRV